MNAFPRRTAAPSVEPITLAEALAHLKEESDSAANDDYIEALIGVAREACEERTERTLITTTWRLTLDAFPDAIVLLRPPVIQVTSVQYFDTDGQLQTLDPADYLLDKVSEPGYLVPGVDKAWPDTQDRINAVTVDYTAGYGATAADVPKPLKQWMLLVIGDLYANRNASAERPAVRQDFADALLQPYRMLGI